MMLGHGAIGEFTLGEQNTGDEFIQAVTATATGTASLSRLTDKIVSRAATGTVSLQRLTDKIVSRAVTGTPSFVKAAARTLTAAAATATITILTPRDVVQPVTALATGTVSMARNIAKIVEAAASGVSAAFAAALRMTSRQQILQDPVDCVLAGGQPFKRVERKWELAPTGVKIRSVISRSGLKKID